MPHVLRKSKAAHHGLVAIPDDATFSDSRLTMSFARLCDEHGLPARLFCQRCEIPVCGECTALGPRHQGHNTIVAIKAIAEDLKQRVRCKTSELQNIHLPSAQLSLSAVEDVSSQLSSHADNVRIKIRFSTKRINDMVEMVMQQKLAKVDDLEELRLKHLNCQHDQVKQHMDSLKSAIGFSEKVLEGETETPEVCDVLFSVEKRAEVLDKARVAEKPVEHGL